MASGSFKAVVRRREPNRASSSATTTGTLSPMSIFYFEEELGRRSAAKLLNCDGSRVRSVMGLSLASCAFECASLSRSIGFGELWGT
jgi:hypothetical protein